MTDDFEASLREALENAVPTTPVMPGRAATARRHSRRVRRTRAALAVGTAAVVVGAAVTLPSVLLSSSGSPVATGPTTRRAIPPLVLPPLAHPFTCPGTPPVHGPLGSSAPDGVIEPGAVLARICPANAKVVSWNAPSEPLVTGLGSLVQRANGLPTTSRTPCEQSDQPAYTLTFQYADGHVESVEGQTGGCGDIVSIGSVVRTGAAPLLRGYLSALHEQRLRYSPPQGQTSPLACPPDPIRVQPILVDGRAPGLLQAMVCDYIDPGPSYALSTGTLSLREIRAVEADIAAHATHHLVVTPEVRNCWSLRGPSGANVITGFNAWGDRVELVGHCTGYTFLDGNGTWYWTPTRQTSAMLDAVVHQVSHPSGRVIGRLLAVGGLFVRPRPLSGDVTLDGRESTTLLTRDGRFSGSVQPGRYRVVGYSPLYNGGKAPCRPQHPFVTVRAGQTVHVSVYCQEK